MADGSFCCDSAGLYTYTIMKKYIIAFGLSLLLLHGYAADRYWALKIQTGAVVPLSEVSYILSSSNAKSFTIVKKDAGEITGVTDARVVRTDGGETGITGIKDEAAIQQAGNDLMIMGAEAGQPVTIFTLDGKVVLRTVTTDGQTRIDISSLIPQAYVLRVGKISVKFLKTME